MQWKASRKSRQIPFRSTHTHTNASASDHRVSVSLREWVHFFDGASPHKYAFCGEHRYDACNRCIGEKFWVFWSNGGFEERVGDSAINARRSHGIRFYNNIPVNRMLQTISNVKRKSKQHIKLVRALLHAVGLRASVQPAASHGARWVCEWYCLQLLVLSVAILWPKSHLPNWSHVNDEHSSSHTKTKQYINRDRVETGWNWDQNERARDRRREKNEKENIFIYFLFYCYCCSWKMKWRYKATGHSHQTTYGRICVWAQAQSRRRRRRWNARKLRTCCRLHTHICGESAQITFTSLLFLISKKLKF